MKQTSTTPSRTEALAVVFAFGTPGGGVLILLSWWLLIPDPGHATEWWEYALVLAYLLAPLWAPLLAGVATLRLAARLDWLDWPQRTSVHAGALDISRRA
jgi:hypothetical protein